MKKDQRFWNVIAILAFICLCAISVMLLRHYANVGSTKLEFFDLCLLGLGTFRLVHLLTYDKIFDIVRDSMLVGGSKKATSGWRRLVREFIECIWCTGMWSAVFVVTIYYLGSWGVLAVIVLAVAGLGSLLQVISKAVAESRR